MAKEEVGVGVTSLKVRSAGHFQGKGSPEGKRVAVDKPTLSDPVCVSGWSEVSTCAFLGGAGWRGQ